MRLLDTTFLIDFLNNDLGAINKAKDIENEKIFTTEINIFEVLFGIYKRKDIDLNKEILIFNDFINILNVLPLAGESTFKSAKMAVELEKKGSKIQTTDCLTAGIALANGINTIVTRNKQHFERIKGIKVEGY